MHKHKKVNQGVSPITTGINEESPLASGITRSTKSYKKAKSDVDLAKELSEAINLYAAGESGSKVLKAEKKQKKKNKRGGDSLRHWENLEPRLRELMNDNNGSLPSMPWMKKHGYSDVLNAITKHHGGLIALRKKLRLELLRRYGEDSLKHWGNLEPMLRKIMKENNGELPSSNWLDNNGYSAVSAAINNYPGKMNALRKKLGLELLRREGNDSLQYWENLLPRLREMVTKNNAKFPSTSWMLEHGYADVSSAIQKYPGKLNAVRKKLGFELLAQTGKDSLSKWENLELKLRELMAKNNGRLPSSVWMNQNGYSSVSNAIKKYPGKTKAVRKKLGFDPIQKRGEDSLSKWENLEPILTEIVLKNNGKLPSHNWMQKHGYSSVAYAIITYPGKTNAVCDKLRQLGILKDQLSDADAAKQLKSALSDYTPGQ